MPTTNTPTQGRAETEPKNTIFLVGSPLCSSEEQTKILAQLATSALRDTYQFKQFITNTYYNFYFRSPFLRFIDFLRLTERLGYPERKIITQENNVKALLMTLVTFVQ